MINTGHGITLAPLLEKQLSQMLVWRNDRRVWKWCRQSGVLSEADHLAWWRSLPQRRDVQMFSILRDNGDFVGVCGLTSIDMVNSRAELSCYIAPAEMRKGLGSAAIKTVIDHAFIDMNLNSVWGEAFADSPANKLAEALGMEMNGWRRAAYFRDGRYVNANLWSIIRGEQRWSGCHLF